MKRIICATVVFLIGLNVSMAQDTLYIHQKVGGVAKTPLSGIDSLKFIVNGYVYAEQEMPKSNFKRWNGDSTIPYQEWNSSYSIENLWNKRWGSTSAGDCFSTKSGGGVSNSITFDLNANADNVTGIGWVIPTHMKLYARYGYGYSISPEYLRVWGSSSPNVSTTNTEGSNAWILLSPPDGFHIAPPSGATSTTATTDDKAYYETTGYDLMFGNSVPPIRYIRLEAVKMWGNANNTIYNYGEIAFWGKVQQLQDSLCILHNKAEIARIPITNIDSMKFEPPKPVKDIDGNVYHTVKIGTQTWMLENLRTTKYRNGTQISTTTPFDKVITAEVNPSYQWAYNGSEDSVAVYGRLYTGYVVNKATDTNDAGYNIAPEGWHVPTNAEWTTLQNYLISNGYNYDNSIVNNYIAKSLSSTTLWTKTTTIGAIGNNLTANNTSGFSAIPCGVRTDAGKFNQIGNYAYWWTASKYPYSAGYAYYTSLFYNSNYLNSSYYTAMSYGYSVRCIKD